MQKRPGIWIEIAIVIPTGYAETVGEFLIREIGVHGVVEEPDATGRPTAGIKFYFAGDDEIDRKMQRLARHLEASGLHGVRCVSCVRLPETQWQSAWQRASVPLQQIGQRLWIKAPWHEVEDPGQREIVEINPAMAFGTGTHPTTRACLLLLEELLPADMAASVSVLDVGCGSGILSIAAIKLGAAEAVAVDHAPEALSAARANAEVNGVAHRIRFTTTPPRNARYDIVVGNIEIGALIELRPLLARALRPGGKLILSGLLGDQADEALAQYRTDGLTLVTQRVDHDWATLLLVLDGDRF